MTEEDGSVIYSGTSSCSDMHCRLWKTGALQWRGGGNVVLIDWAVLFSFCGFTGQIAVFLITKVRVNHFGERKRKL